MHRTQIIVSTGSSLHSSAAQGSGSPSRQVTAHRVARLEAGILLPEQMGSKSPLPGALRLMSALLEEATACFQKHVLALEQRDRRLFSEAEEWLMQDDTGAAVSFPEVCEILGLGPEYIRDGLRKWKTEQQASRSDVSRLESDGPRHTRLAAAGQHDTRRSRVSR